MKYVAFAYSILVYVLFFAAFLYLIAFIGGAMVPLIQAPKTLDWGGSFITGLPAAAVNIGLLLVFGLQHSIMARPGFKRAITKVLPKSVERSTYVLLTVAVLVLLYAGWIPMPGAVWEVNSPLWAGLLTGLFYLALVMVLVSTFLINHFELFGLEQGWAAFRNREPANPKFYTPYLYKLVRHPLYTSFLIAFWATPYMSVGHLLFASIWTAYILVAIGYEERDLTTTFGDQYIDYMAKTPMILPVGRRK
ncbi:methanethiol S-methyltransferase [Henriciella marina]|uniref:methanethiol S-methyltransferase n=1 Tax=Henriciella marina TaxID=453851 RepID=UPI000371E6A8|nr:methanethiol S-methyltransferase [Henriciella marina]